MRRAATTSTLVGAMWAMGHLTGCQETLLSNQSEVAVNDAVALLRAHGIAASRGRQGRGYTLHVAGSDRDAAWQTLRAAGLPRAQPQVPAPALVLTPTQAYARVRSGQARQLERLLATRPDVIEAAVTLAAHSAAVVLRVPAGPAPAAPEIAALVRAGAGLGPQDPVAVTRHTASAPATQAAEGDLPAPIARAARSPRERAAPRAPTWLALAGVLGVLFTLVRRRGRPRSTIGRAT